MTVTATVTVTKASICQSQMLNTIRLLTAMAKAMATATVMVIRCWRMLLAQAQTQAPALAPECAHRRGSRISAVDQWIHSPYRVPPVVRGAPSGAVPFRRGMLSV